MRTGGEIIEDLTDEGVVALAREILLGEAPARPCEHCGDPIEGPRAKWCARCGRRNQNLRNNFGITLEDFDEMVEAQKDRCAICKTTEPKGRGSNFHVDHCHSSGEIRGLLCHKCNLGLGMFEDRPEVMKAAVKYLEDGGAR